MATKLTTNDLTRGEKLALLRRRENLRQEESALRFNVSRDTYHKWENDINSTAPSLEVDDLAVHEVCYILRRRARLTQKQLASYIGTSRVTVNRMEKGEAPAFLLANYWEV